MEYVFIIQARVGSTRMPQKIMLPFYGGKSILDIIVEGLKDIPDSETIIAIPDSAPNDMLEKKARDLGIKCFRGAEDDVLQRFIDAAERFGADKIIRVCSDNPFLSIPDIGEIVCTARNSEYDYISFMIDGIPSIKTHYGFYAEYVTLDALRKVRALTQERIYHEHVTNYIYTHPGKFNILWLQAHPLLSGRNDIRLTIDTPEDFESARSIYRELSATSKAVPIESIVGYIDNHSDIRQRMQEQIAKNSK